jgi:protein-disulfide isomerase
MTKESKIILSISAAVIVGVIFLMAVSPNASNLKVASQSFLIDNAIHITGNKNAKVTIVEFGDYECPACGAAYPILKKVIDAYKGNTDFNFVFRNFPLSQHKNALIAAESAEAAGAQGKFWEMEGLLYENQNEWSESSAPIDIFINYAKNLGLSTNKFKSEIESNKYKSIIETDKSDGNSVNVEWTPTIYINGERQEQMLTFEQFKSKIDGLLKK